MSNPPCPSKVVVLIFKKKKKKVPSNKVPFGKCILLSVLLE